MSTLAPSSQRRAGSPAVMSGASVRRYAAIREKPSEARREAGWCIKASVCGGDDLAQGGPCGPAVMRWRVHRTDGDLRA